MHATPCLALMLAITLTAACDAAAVEHAPLHEAPEHWQLMPEASWRFAPATETLPAHMAITKVGPTLNKPVRRPYTTAVLTPETMQQDGQWANTISLRLRSLEPEGKKGRDAVVVLGYVDDTHYTYVHVSNDADGRAHNIIMKVQGDQRRTIHQPAQPEPRLTGDGWHDVKVTYDRAGRIHVYMNDMAEPLMRAVDADVVDKPMGVGSFNDRAAFTAIKLGRSPTPTD